jgi:hypothetical protein
MQIMRVFVAILLFAAALLQFLLGGGLILSSRYEAFRARTEAGDLSEVAGDLVSEQELEKMRQDARQKVGAAGAKQLALGVAVLALAFLQLAGGVLVLVRPGRATLLVRGGIALGAVVLVAVILLDGFATLIGVVLGLQVLSFLLALLVRPRTVAPA